MPKDTTPKTGLELLREPFLPNQISKLPKPTKAQTDEVRADFKKGIRCEICGTWHHPKVVHLDYVGHAALTDRLLDCDPGWNWEPVATNEDGTPKFDTVGGLWIRLTVCGVTRLGYGHAEGKKGGDAIKEVIGDALRNAGMRFGAALDLWHKGQLHAVDDDAPSAAPDGQPTYQREIENEPAPAVPPDVPMEVGCQTQVDGAMSLSALQVAWKQVNAAYQGAGRAVPAALVARKDKRKAELSAGDPQAPVGPTEPPF